MSFRKSAISFLSYSSISESIRSENRGKREKESITEERDGYSIGKMMEIILIAMDICSIFSFLTSSAR